jgi:cytochrome c
LQAWNSKIRAALLAACLAGISQAVSGQSASPVTPQMIATRVGCSGCHALDHKVLGPSYQDIAARYSGDTGAATTLMERMRSGSRGIWGPLEMQPVTATRASDAELATLIGWILGQ